MGPVEAAGDATFWWCARTSGQADVPEGAAGAAVGAGGAAAGAAAAMRVNELHVPELLMGELGAGATFGVMRAPGGKISGLAEEVVPAALR